MFLASINASPPSPNFAMHAFGSDARDFAMNLNSVSQARGEQYDHVVIEMPEDISCHLGREENAPRIGEVRIPIPEEQMLRRDLEELFAPIRSKENTQEVDRLIGDRVKHLTAEGIDSKRFQQLIRAVERRDRNMGLLHGAVQGGAPFACASLIFDLFMAGPILARAGGNLAELGAAAGAFQGAMDVVFGRVLQESFNDAYYTRGRPAWASTEDVPGVSERMWQLMCGLAVPYSVRNVVRAFVDVGLAATAGPGAVTVANLVIDSIGGLAAGAGTRYMMSGHERRAGSWSAACLLARDDWMEGLAASEQGVSLESAHRAGGALIGAAGRAIRAVPSGIAALGSPSGLTGMGILTGGLAGLVPAQDAAGRAVSTYGPIAGEAGLRLANVFGLAFLYASLGAGIVLAAEPGRLKSVSS
jgi:hypothetical protein